MFELSLKEQQQDRDVKPSRSSMRSLKTWEWTTWWSLGSSICLFWVLGARPLSTPGIFLKGQAHPSTQNKQIELPIGAYHIDGNQEHDLWDFQRLGPEGCPQRQREKLFVYDAVYHLGDLTHMALLVKYGWNLP